MDIIQHSPIRNRCTDRLCMGKEQEMTREEAIEFGKTILLVADSNDDDSAIEFTRIAISALSQEPCDVFDEYGNYKYPSDVELAEPNTATSMPCDDAISREAVIKILEKYNLEMSKIAEELNELPSVTQKSGKWIMSDDGLYRPICNKCGAHPWKGYIPTVEEATEVFKYCPNCGAKMESEDKK